MKQEEGVVCGGGGAQDSSGQRQQWQINLLDHIDAVQDDVTHRMDFIERELDGETWAPAPWAYYSPSTSRCPRALVCRST